MTTKKSRDDDSAEAVKVDVADAKERLGNIEAALLSPDRLGQLIIPALKDSVQLRKQIAETFLEIMDDYDNRKELEKIIGKIDRRILVRWGKYLTAFVVGAATVLAAIFGYIAIT